MTRPRGPDGTITTQDADVLLTYGKDVPSTPSVVIPTELALLLDRAAAGDSTAAADVYDRTAVKAYRLVVLVVGDTRLATEVCAQAFNHLWSVWSAEPDRDHRAASADTWLLMTMHRFATDHMRQRNGGASRRPPAATKPRRPRKPVTALQVAGSRDAR